MKEKWKFGHYEEDNNDTTGVKNHYFRMKQRLLWRFYFRFVKR